MSEGERSVNEIQTILNKEGSAVSQQLSVLRSKNIVVGTKDGKRVLYSLRDPMIVDLLVVARKIFNNHLIDTISMLEELDEAERETIVNEVKLSIEVKKEDIIQHGMEIFRSIGAHHVCNVCIKSGNSCCFSCQHLQDGVGCQREIQLVQLGYAEFKVFI